MKKTDKILVTGGNGMVGKNLIEELKSLGFSNIIAPSSVELNLKNRDDVFNYFKIHSPELVFHLAAKVGGIRANINNPVEFMRDNLLINTNVIDACFKFNIKKLVNLGSSCIYPRGITQPMKENALLSDKLEPTNEGYALSKICSLKLCKYYNEQYKTNFISLMPPNLYGKYDKFDSQDSHVMAALIIKFYDAKLKNLPEVSVWGDGEARREFLYSEDLSKILIYAMKNISTKDLWDNCFLNCGVSYDISIKELAFFIKNIVGFSGGVVFDTEKPEGMRQKLLDSSKLKLIKKFDFTDIKNGIKSTLNFYTSNLKT